MAYRRARPVALSFLIFVLLGVSLVAPVFAADCGGETPCSCGDSVIASRKLVRGVDPVTTTPCSGDGLIITGGGVVIDLGGASLRGSLAEGSIGILSPATGRLIRNGTVASFGIGISGDVDVERVEVVDNAGHGIVVAASGPGPTVRTSIARRNGGSGIVVGCGEIRDSHAEQNGSHGVILFTPACTGTVSHVVSRENGGSGFWLAGDGPRVDRSLAIRNIEHGYVTTGQDLIAMRSQAVENGGHGLSVLSVFGTFFELRTKGNAGFGIYGPPDPHFGQNLYGPGNYCQGDALGDSDPPGLCQ